jgi:hypothetical protein
MRGERGVRGHDHRHHQLLDGGRDFCLDVDDYSGADDDDYFHTDWHHVNDHKRLGSLTTNERHHDLTHHLRNRRLLPDRLLRLFRHRRFGLLPHRPGL